MAYGPRSTNFNPWHYCSRCGVKRHISAMSWQKGKLLCHEDCFDDPQGLIGVREMKIAQVLGDGKVELQIVHKLREPDSESGNDDIYFD